MYSIWNSAQCYVPGRMEAGFREDWIHVLCVAESLHCLPETTTTFNQHNSTTLISTTFNQPYPNVK